MNRTEKTLSLLLRLGGAVMLAALGAVVMPFDWMNRIHQFLGMGALPDFPIVGYLTRSLSAFYALHGALLLFVAGDVRRYLPVIRFLALAAGVFGAVMLVLDRLVGMPLGWTVVEGPYVAAISALLFWLAGRTGKVVSAAEVRSPASEGSE